MASSSASFKGYFNYSSFGKHSNQEHFDDYTAKKLSASKLLFAEDLVSYIAKNFYGISYNETEIQKCRELLYVAFNDTVREAVTFIRNHLSTECKISFEVFCNLSDSAKDFYSDFVNEVLDDNDECRSDVGLFLYYCVYFADLASRCYTKEIPEIMEYAVYSILDAFFKFDRCKWSDLENVAKKIVTFSHYPHISESIKEKQTNNQSEIFNECGKRILDLIDKLHQDDYDETKIESSDSVPSENTSPIEYKTKIESSDSVPSEDTSPIEYKTKIESSDSVPSKDTFPIEDKAKIESSDIVPSEDTFSIEYKTKIESSDSVPSEDTFPIEDETLSEVYYDKADTIELISENISEPSYMKSELEQNISMISVSNADIAYFLNLPTAVKTVVNSKALAVAVALLDCDDSGEDSSD